MNNTSTGNISAGTGGSSEAFEAFENGASIEEINEKYFSHNNDQSEAEIKTDISAGDNADNSSPENADNTDSVRQAESAQSERGNDGENAKESDVATSEQTFSQSDVDSIVGRRIEKERRMRDSLQSDFDNYKIKVSKMLGVDVADVDSAIENEVLKREMSDSDIDDPELFMRARRAEIERDELKQRLSEQNEVEEKNKFAEVIITQLREFEVKNPGADIVKMSSDDNFNKILKSFYDNDSTRDSCVIMAARAFGYDVFPNSGSKDVNSSGNSDGSSSDTRQINRERSSESAGHVRSPMSTDKKFDYDKMSLSDFDDIQSRVARGERIIP